MNEKENLIYSILRLFRFDYVKPWIDTLEFRDILKTNSCSVETWNSLLSIYDITPYTVAKKALEQVCENHNSSLESLKAEIYNIGKDRNPSARHIQALLSIIFEKKSFQSNSILRSTFEINKLLTFTQFLQDLTSEDSILIYSEEKANILLQTLNIHTLQLIYEKFVSIEWINIDTDYSDEDYITEYLEEMDSTNLSFLYHNIECLCIHYDKIKFILQELVHADPKRLEQEYNNLKKKRIYSSSVGDCCLDLKKLKYEELNQPSKREMIKEIEEYLSDFSDMESLIYCIGKLTLIKWNYLLLLIENYEGHPTGKKVSTWLEKVRYI